MSKAKTKSPDAWAWLTKAQTAAAVGYSVRNFSERIQPRLEAGAMRGKGATKRFDVRAVVVALVAYVIEQNAPKPEDVDPLLGAAGETSDALEEFRRESTEKVRLANAATRGQLVDRAKVLDALSQGFNAAATAASRLVLKFGNDAGEMWNEAIEAMRSASTNALQSNKPDAV